MKRHLSNLLQGKRSEFGAAAPAAVPASRRAATTMPAELNGYDWLRRINHARVVRAAKA
jgi:hypothetical protein